MAPMPKALDRDRLLEDEELVDATSLLETAELLLLLLLSELLPKEKVDTPLDRSERRLYWDGTSYWLFSVAVCTGAATTATAAAAAVRFWS